MWYVLIIHFCKWQRTCKNMNYETSLTTTIAAAAAATVATKKSRNRKLTCKNQNEIHIHSKVIVLSRSLRFEWEFNGVA